MKEQCGVELRAWDTDDALALARLIREDQPRLYRWLPWATPDYGREDARAFIDLCRNQARERQGWGYGLLVDGSLAGGIGLNDVDLLNGTASLGYWIGRAFEGRGAVTIACRMLLAQAFDDLGLERIEIRAEPDNRRSRAVPERLGFTEEGTLRHVLYWPGPGGRFVDHVVYAMLHDEWQAGKGPPARGADHSR